MRRTFPQGLENPSVLVRVPKGYDGDHPAADFLRMRGFGAHHGIADRVMEGHQGLDTVIHAMKVARPFVAFVNAAIAGRS